ncbi:hypothetical protein [Aquisphaera insulae]|uniref:hypothetical protein n=1 Tax=Aquisphaera insulae TaxID=2712864 RepID=UPI002030AB66|nr:hypothetical protein [Aquisphaera insulae]
MIGRHDRETIECGHSMNDRSLARHWPVIAGRLECSGLVVVARPEAAASAGTEADE